MYTITGNLHIRGTVDGLTYRLAIEPSPSGSGFVLNLEVARFGGPDKIGIVEAELRRIVRQIGFAASGMIAIRDKQPEAAYQAMYFHTSDQLKWTMEAIGHLENERELENLRRDQAHLMPYA